MRDNISGFTAEQLDQLYDRIKIIAGIAVQRNAIIVINPTQQDFMHDMMQRMAEDTEFLLRYESPPPVLVNEHAEEGEIKFSVPGSEGKLLSIKQLVNSATGYGRYSSIGLPTRGEHMRPWGKRG
jgi:hypothetical protein